MENPNEPKKSKFSEQPHYFQCGLTAFCVIGCCVLVAFVLIKLPFIWNVVKKLFGALSPFIYGFVMAYLLMPVFNMLYRRIQPPMSRKFTHGTRIAKGISSLLVGMDAADAIRRMRGTTCGPRPTSCPDQISLALEEALEKLKRS